MRKIKQNFFAASIAWAVSATAAYAVPVFDVGAPAVPTGALAFDAANPDLVAAPAAAEAPQQPAAADDSPAALIPEPSNWSMLLVGAGVLLLPRRRRTDNSVR